MQLDGPAPSPTANEAAEGQAPGRPDPRWPLAPTAVSCLAERETAKNLVPEQQAMDKRRTRIHLKLFWFWAQ